MKPNIDQTTPFATCHPNHAKDEKSEAQKRSQAYLIGVDDGYTEAEYQYRLKHPEGWFALGMLIEFILVMLIWR